MITVIGSLNMDLLIEVARLPRRGETVPGTDLRRAPGGKGANQAVAAARLGARVAMIGAVGADAVGNEMIANLAAAGVDTSGIERRPGDASGSALIVVERDGQNQIVIAAGANGTLSAADVAQHAGLIRRSHAVIAQLETPLEAVDAAFGVAREAGVTIILNPAPFVALDESLLRRCDWIIPNEIEAERLGGLDVRDVAGARAAAHAIQQRSGGANIIVTLGAEGAWITSSSFTGHILAPKVEALDTVGAGDTFIGAFAARLVEGSGAREAARFACAAAALAVTRRGAQAGIPTRAEVEAFVK
jgi:ribokinase